MASSPSPRVQLSLKGRLLSEVAFVGPQLRIGRMRENDVVVNNLAVSRFHAVLKREGDGFVLEDLGSENGTMLSGQRVSGSAPMKPSDVIQLGKYELRLVVQPGIAIASAPKPKASDAWDASQTFLALEPPQARTSPATIAPTPAVKPALAPSGLTAKPAAASLAAKRPPVATPPTPASPTPPAAAEPSDLLMLDALDLEPEAELAPLSPAAPPDPDGVFAFSEADLAPAANEPAEPDSDLGMRTDPLPAPVANPELTSLFDFGTPDSPAAPAAVRDVAEEIPAELEQASDAPGPAPASPLADEAAAARVKLYAGLIVQRDGKLHLLRAWEDGELCAGRAPECDIVLADAGVSRRHAIFTRSGDRYGVRDLESVNGIYVNSQRTKQHELAVGDVVRIESFELTFVLDHSPIGSEVSGPAAVPGKAHERSRATQFSLDAPAQQRGDELELEAVAMDPTAPAAEASLEDPGDAFEILPPADDPLAGDAPTAEPVAALELPESDLISAEGLDDEDEKDATVQGMTGAQALQAAAVTLHGVGIRLRLSLDSAQLSPRTREALAALAEEGAVLSARLSFERE
jgi:pSer/pThr/pTyr-binding forkhead associated (FHA) protein